MDNDCAEPSTARVLVPSSPIIKEKTSKSSEEVTREGQATNESSEISMDNLHESVLTEIFHRIPCIKSLVRCTSVCRLWFNLISSPFFINRLLLHQQRPKPFALLLCHNRPISKDPVFGDPRFKLSFLMDRALTDTVSSCNDLLLCSTSSTYYCILNPLTLKCLTLPPIPKKLDYSEEFKVGLLSNYQGKQWKHWVIRIYPVLRELVAEIFSSEVGDWTEPVVLGPYYKLYGNSVACNGALHWLAEPSAIIAYDFDDKEQYRLISCPIATPTMEIPWVRQCLGVCCGVLRILELTAFRHSDDCYLTVWELKDYPNGNWNVEHRIRFKEFVSSQIPAADQLQDFLLAIGIHPTDRDVVFLRIDNCVVSCNLDARQLKIEATTRNFCTDAFPLELQWWPTPIPALPQRV